MVKTYNPKQVTVSIGTHIVTGFADDSFITVESLGDGISSVSGCDGEVGRSIDPNGQYSVKISLLQTSDSNQFLSKLYDSDKKNGDGIRPLLIKDLRGGMVFQAESAWVKQRAGITKGKSLNNREWELETDEGTLEEGKYS